MLSSAIVIYLFLGGLGAGLGLITSVQSLTRIMQLNKPIKKQIEFFNFDRAYAIKHFLIMSILITSALFLLIDLGAPEKFLLIFKHPHFTYLNIGAYSLTVLIVFNFSLALYWLNACSIFNQKLFFFLSSIVVIFSVIVAIYTGLLLSGISAIPFWHNIFLPTLFLISSLTSGNATLYLVDQLIIKNHLGINKYSYVVSLALSILELLIFILFAAFSFSSQYQLTSVNSMQQLFVGDFSGVFIIGFIVMGVIVPIIYYLALLMKGLTPRISISSFVAVFIIIGAFILRFYIVFVAARPNLPYIMGL